MSGSRPTDEREAGHRAVMELSLPSDTRYLVLVRDLTRRFAESHGFEPSDAQKMGLAVDEATTNVIEHAYHGRSDREIEIHFDPEGDDLCVQILHDGDPIDPEHLPEFSLERFVAERKSGGLGIYIMKQVMDRVDYGTSGSGKSICLMVRSKRGKPREE
jgi:anti-sigma regulatory factor (Ser/Thr protein kinase)